LSASATRLLALGGVVARRAAIYRQLELVLVRAVGGRAPAQIAGLCQPVGCEFVLVWLPPGT
jgi:hypothetical protein